MKIAHKIIDMPLQRTMVKGVLSGDEHCWSFQCLNLEFLKLFPEGVVHSFSYFGYDNKHYEHRQFQLAVATRVGELRSRRASAKNGAAQPEAPAAPRRFVIP